MKRIFSNKFFLILPLFALLFYVFGQTSSLNIPNSISKLFSSEKETKEIKEIKNSASEIWADKKLANLSLRQKIGQFFMIGSSSNKGESHFKEVDSLIQNQEVGGVIFFQGQRENLQQCIKRYQDESSIPLLIAMDAEWGVSMRLFGEDRFPYNYTLGAANNPKLTEKIAKMIGQECRELGIHINFAPVADVNSNLNNPVIGFRSYGEYPKDVAAHVRATVKGLESQGVMTSIKHFPGHGDTDVDSHLDLPVVNNTYKHINAVDFFPFRAGISAGASSVMMAHLSVPALDETGTPSSLSQPIIQDYLKGELGFKGLVVSDALRMKVIADRFGKVEAVVQCFEAGCDILLLPESVGDAIDAILSKVNDGEITMDEINARCKKILVEKHKRIIAPKKFKKYTKGEIELAKKQVYEQAITVLKNENEVLPIKRFDKKIAHVSIGLHNAPMEESMDLVTKVDHFHFFTGEEALRRMGSRLQEYDVVITSIHAKRVSKRGDYGMPKDWKKWLTNLPESKENIFALLGNPYVLKASVDLSKMKAVVVGYENNQWANDRMGQFIMGTFAAKGHLPVTINPSQKRGGGLAIASANRLKESQPEELGINPKKLSEIDSIVMKGIRAGAFPGCQIVVAVKGKVIYRKSFGNHTYSKDRPVKNDDVYDIASITKIAASTLSLMYYNSQGELNLNQRVKDFLPELTKGTPYANLVLRDMMAHQARLKPWIPFYAKSLKNGRPNPEYYAKDSSTLYNKRVATNLWILGSYTDKIYDSILATPLLKRKKYKYSDLGYYFMKKIIEKKSEQSLDQFVTNQFYKPMGLNNLRYYPRRYFPLSKITPTENDTIFRKTLVHGYVHDQGAAMMGGVGGHAGLFSNALDLAKLMQMYLNEGNYGGKQYIQPQVIEEYTDCQFCPKNRRGAGFDKPVRSLDGGPTCKLVSLKSFGHSGFTGTLVWADPVKEINYVFLSNRVYPNAENWKLVRMDIRTEIQRVIYEAVNSAK